jgi:hypothetical protein
MQSKEMNNVLGLEMERSTSTDVFSLKYLHLES